MPHPESRADVQVDSQVDSPADSHERTIRQEEWVATMHGAPTAMNLVLAHRDAPPPPISAQPVEREEREARAAATLSPGATLGVGGGNRINEEAPDQFRTCFERDRDRILHSAAFRRLAGKTQVFVFPDDHQRTRLTHALEVAQVATAMSRALGLNVALTEAIALGHDCGHGPGGHASEDAFDAFLPNGYHHAVWGADVVLQPLNLCVETLDGIRNHSWSRPTPSTPEGVVVSWADRCAYTAHDLEDAISAEIVSESELPEEVITVLGTSRRQQLHALIHALVDATVATGSVGMESTHASALAALRSFNYERIYNRPASLAQGRAVIDVLTALVEHFAATPQALPSAPDSDPLTAAITYVAGMTDRFAFETAERLLDWPVERRPLGIDLHD
jgi:dGTPase